MLAAGRTDIPPAAATSTILESKMPDKSTTTMPSVYFIQSGEGGPIKIGKSVSVKSRLTSLMTASGTELRLMGTIAPGGPTEAEMHRRFACFRLRREWFTPADELLKFIADSTYTEPVVADSPAVNDTPPRRGRPPKPPGEGATERAELRLTPLVMSLLDLQRGKLSRAAYVAKLVATDALRATMPRLGK